MTISVIEEEMLCAVSLVESRSPRPSSSGQGRSTWSPDLCARQPTKDYAELYERYWSGVREHLLKLEGRIGSIARVYHEAVGLAGEEGLAEAEKLNEKSASIARGKVDAGAVFEAVEDEDLVTETFDWQRCLMVGLENKKVADLVWAVQRAVRKR